MRIEDVGRGMKPKLHEKETKEKKPRGVAVKNAMFFLYKKDVGNLSLIDSFRTEVDIRYAYEKALDEGIPEEELIGIKGRYLEFEVKEKKRRITVR